MQKNSLKKDFASRLSLDANKMLKVYLNTQRHVPLGKESGTTFRSEIKHTLGEMQNVFIRLAEGVSRTKMFEIRKKNIKKVPQKKWSNLNCKQLRAHFQLLEQKQGKSPKDPYLEVLVEKKRESSNKIYYKNLKPFIFQVMAIF